MIELVLPPTPSTTVEGVIQFIKSTDREILPLAEFKRQFIRGRLRKGKSKSTEKSLKPFASLKNNPNSSLKVPRGVV